MNTNLRDDLFCALDDIGEEDCEYDAGDDGLGGWINATVTLPDGATLGVGWWLYTDPSVKGISATVYYDIRQGGYSIVPYVGHECAITIPEERRDEYAAALDTEPDRVAFAIARIWSEEASDDSLAADIWRKALRERAHRTVDDAEIGDLLRFLRD